MRREPLEALLRAISCVFLVGLTACDSFESGPPPYGFEQVPEQRFRLEFEARTELNGSLITVQQLVEFRLLAEPLGDGRVDLSLFLSRYFESVDGAPDGARELALTAQGLVTRTAEHGEVRLGPDDPNPGGGKVRSLLERAQASTLLDSNGRMTTTLWQSLDPILAGIHVLEWVLLGFPVLEPEAAWQGKRELPPMAQYQLGMALPLYYERLPNDAGTGDRIRARGEIRRRNLRITEDFVGDLQIDFAGETRFGPQGRVGDAKFELRMNFDGASNERVSTRYRVQLRCMDCESPPDQTF